MGQNSCRSARYYLGNSARVLARARDGPEPGDDAAAARVDAMLGRGTVR
jgi:hypothetical protein